MLQKTIGKQRNILRPLPQRGKYQMNGVQPVQQIFTKRTVMHHLIDRAIGGGEKTDIHRDCLVAAYTGHTTALQHCEQLSLSRRRDRKSTRLNSSHANISYAVFCLKKKRDVVVLTHLGRC